MESIKIILGALALIIVVQMAMSSPTHCGCVPSCHGYGSGYGCGYGYGSGYGRGYGYGSGYGTEFGEGYGSGYGYGHGCSKVVKLPIYKKTTVVRQPFVHETRQAVVTVHEPAVKNTHADRPHVSSYVQKACKSYVENEVPSVPHPVIPTPTCDDHEGSYYGGSYSGPHSYYSPSHYSPSYYSSHAPAHYKHGGCRCGCYY